LKPEVTPYRLTHCKESGDLEVQLPIGENSFRLSTIIAVVTILLGICSTVAAQTGSSTITGSVRDVTGAAIPNARIRVVNEATGFAKDIASNEDGLYRVSSLAPGVYRIEAEAEGFDKLVRSKVALEVSQVLAVDVALQVGKQSETVNVEGAAELTESQSASVGQLIGRKMVAELPMPNRAATSLVALAPGVVMIDTGSSAENYPIFSVAGGRARNQDFTLDGGNVTNAVGLTRPQQMTSLPMDAMQEFRVISNNYAAEHGHSTGGIITLSTRSGTNDLHGSLFEYARNDAFDARNFFSAQKPPLRMHQFGGSLGGPIRKDKTHFFATWEQTRQLISLATISTVPSLAQRQGDFSGLVDAKGNPILIYDRATTSGKTRQAFAGNVIPQSRFDPVAKAALDYWPLSNRPATKTGSSNYLGNAPSNLHRNIVVGKLDHQFRPSDQFMARYYINDSTLENLGSFGIPESDPAANHTDVRIQSFMAGHTHIFRPTLINELRVSYLRRKFIDERYGAGENLAARIGLTGVSDASFPTFTVPGYVSLGLSGSVSRHQTPITDTEIQNAISYFSGRHAWKFGGEFRRGSNQEQRDRASSGNFIMSPLITSLPGTPGSGNAMASLLLGEVNSASILNSDVILSRASYWAGYAQDDWRITDRLTLNYGLRWESEIPRYVDSNRMNSFDPYAINPVSNTPGVVTFAGVNGVPRRAFNTDLNNFGPRLGFAWKVTERTVIRGGSGIFYGPTVSNSIGDAASLGFSDAASFVVAQADIQSALILKNGVPPYTRPAVDAGFGAVAAGQKPNTAVTFFERDRPTPISYQYNLNVQREMTSNLLLEVGYIANVSHRLTANDISINQVAPQLMGPGDAQARRPFPQFSNVSIINPAIGNSTYHAGYFKAEKRFSRGFSFLAHYTFSKMLDDVASTDEYGDPQSYMDAYNRRLDKGRSGTDVPHRMVASVLYEVPRVSHRRAIDAVAGGWKLGVFGTFQSGPPFTVVSASNTTNAFPAGGLRPNLIADPNLPDGQQTLGRWFDTSAFAQPAPFTFGNSPRSGLRGAGIQTVDLTLLKEFAITERWRTELRGEFYNLLNHANFDIPGHTLGAADFGVVSSARPARAAQLGLRVSF
jgi:hypothetical protein